MVDEEEQLIFTIQTWECVWHCCLENYLGVKTVIREIDYLERFGSQMVTTRAKWLQGHTKQPIQLQPASFVAFYLSYLFPDGFCCRYLPLILLPQLTIQWRWKLLQLKRLKILRK